MTDPIQYFYDRLADDYHLLFTDWPEAVRWQASVLDRLIRREQPLEQWPAILDCACGIGTQALGLALLGHSVHGTDISPVAVERARYEAAQLGVAVIFGVADMRTLDRDVGRVFDVVLAFDNSLPHLLGPADMQLAAHAIRRTLCPGGVFLASTRDYDAQLAQRPHVEVPRVIDGPDGRRIVFQVWDWGGRGECVQCISLFWCRLVAPGELCTLRDSIVPRAGRSSRTSCNAKGSGRLGGTNRWTAVITNPS